MCLILIINVINDFVSLVLTQSSSFRWGGMA